MVTGSRPRPLVGRGRECDTLGAVLTGVASGHSNVLVLRGEAGVGKTALLDYLVQQSSGMRIARLAGVESDMQLAFAGLQQLCAPLLTYAGRLPEPQQEALSVAFGRNTGPAPDRFLVGLAVLSLLALAADVTPLLIVVDDAQWLDDVTVQTLAFVARRLVVEPVALVFAVRDAGASALAGLPELPVEPLSDDDGRQLLESVMVGGIDPRVRDRVVAETRGVPLALLEVPRNVPAAELAGGFWVAGSRPSAGSVEVGFIRRIQSLPPATRTLLTAAAAEPLGDATLFLRAGKTLGISIEALEPAEAAGLIEFGSRMRFPHPLARSAAYVAADLSERRTVHRALAEATDSAVDPDRRAWHSANAAVGPDDSVAAELEASAERAQRRGGVAAAAAFMARATVLTSDPVLRGSRAIVAAQAKREAAAAETAYELLAIADVAPLSPLQRAQVARMRAQMEFARSRSGDVGAPAPGVAAAALATAATALESLADDVARETHLEALTAAMYAGRLGASGALAEIARAGRAAVDRVAELRRPVDFLLSGMTSRILDGPGAGSAELRTALQLWTVGDGHIADWPSPIAQESAAHELWDDAVLLRIATDMVRRARNAGALRMLPYALAYRAGVHVYAGELADAAALIDEADAISASTGSSVRYRSLVLAAWQGTGAGEVSRLEEARADGTRRGEGRLVGLTWYAAAVLFNGLGRYEEALHAARECCRYEDLGFYTWGLIELLEAAAHLGDDDTATSALARIDERAGVSGTDWGTGAAAGARALVATGDEAERLFEEAVERLDRAHLAVQTARTRLNYGEWLRRANRRADARRQLTRAYEEFTRMGARAFAERARRELAATGEKVRRQPVGSGGQLTPQEAQIARLAADGLTNQEIGAQLFISMHTVEWHLRKVFVKLDITSRRQLRTTPLPSR